MPVDSDKARDLYVSGRLHDCLVECERILAADSTNAPAYHLIGLLCFRGGEPEEAIKFFSESLNLAPDFAEAYFNLALALKTQGRLEEALDVYAKGITIDPNDAQAHYNFGLALRQAGRLPEARTALRSAVALEPYLPGAYNILGQLNTELGYLEEAADSFRKAIGAHPEAMPAYGNLATVLRQLGQFDQAMMVLRWGVGVHGIAAMGRPLAAVQEDMGDVDGAIAVVKDLLRLDPTDADLWETLGRLQMRLCHFAEALESLQRCLAWDERRPWAHMRIFSLAQILKQPALALQHQNRALTLTRLFSEKGGDASLPSLLILNAPGDWQRNLPTDFIIQREAWSAVHQYYVSADGGFDPSILPACDVVLSAVAEPDLARAELAAAAAIIDHLGRPCINDPRRIAETRRETVAETLAGLPTTVVPAVYRLPAVSAFATLTDLLARGNLCLPVLLRPVGTHAGNGLVRVETVEQLAGAVAGIDGDELYAVQFVDYRSDDGLYRKFRVAVVDGVPYPFHLALSKRWMVHYYNAVNDDQAMMDAEEEHFLANFASVFAPALQADLSEMARRLGLDIFIVDCGIARDGRLVLFEVDTGAIIHTLDDPIRYAYKHTYVPRIFDAVQAMIKARIP